MNNIHFTEADFKALESKYPEAYWFTISQVMIRQNQELAQKLHDLGPIPSDSSEALS